MARVPRRLAAVALACCAAPAAAAPTSITEFPSEPKAKYIEGSPLNNSVWITIEGVGHPAVRDGRRRGAGHGAGSPRTWRRPTWRSTSTGPSRGRIPPGRPRRRWASPAGRAATPPGSITRTQAGNADTRGRGRPAVAGRVASDHRSLPHRERLHLQRHQLRHDAHQGRFDDKFPGLAIDGGGRVWAFSQNNDQALPPGPRCRRARRGAARPGRHAAARHPAPARRPGPRRQPLDRRRRRPDRQDDAPGRHDLVRPPGRPRPQRHRARARRRALVHREDEQLHRPDHHRRALPLLPRAHRRLAAVRDRAGPGPERLVHRVRRRPRSARSSRATT